VSQRRGSDNAAEPVAVEPCSESSGSRNRKVTCFSNDEILEIARGFNKASRTTDLIKIDGVNPSDVLAELHVRLSSLCESERCWLGLGILGADKERKLDLRFAPKMPSSWRKNPNEWLSNEDIEDAIERHTAHITDFRLLGVEPMDFMSKAEDGQCVSSLCNFRFNDLIKQGITRAALVLNTDNHKGPGRHWVAVYIEANGDKGCPGVYYFDSVGRAPTAEVNDFAERVMEDLKLARVSPEPVYAFNDNHLQKTNTECGVFCLVFVISMIVRGCFKDVCDQIGDDVDMMRLRARLFR
jgi:hypothetical protein